MRSWRIAFVCLTIAAACSGTQAANKDDHEHFEEGELTILFSPMYSAHDGVHDFKIPAIVDGVPKVKWSASDPSMVDLDPTADGVLITTRKPGKVTITAKAG